MGSCFVIPERGGAGGIFRVNAKIDGLKDQFLSTNDRTARELAIVCKSALPGEYVEKLILWIAFLRINGGLSVNTVGNYLHGVFNFMLWLETENIKLLDVKSSNIVKWMQYCFITKKDCTKTRGLNLISVRRFYTWVELEGGIINPVRAVQGPKKEKRVPRKYSSDQLKRLFAAPNIKKIIGIRDFAILLFLYSTGARRSEVATLDLSQIELEQRVGTVRFNGKGSKERVLSFEGPAVVALRDWLYVRDTLNVIDDQAVFLGVNGRNKNRRIGFSGLSGVLKRAAKTAGIRGVNDGDLGLHKMRSTYATALYDQGVDIETIRLLMGHDDINTTREYLAITERQIKTRMPTSHLNTLLGQQKELPRYVTNKINY